MIRRKGHRDTEKVDERPKGFDDYALCLGDMMRGERATLGKSLLDVQRELRIRASYISAIENSDPSAFETPGFIAGYVRSYARYLGMDPESAFDQFCDESGFATAHGMSAEASTIRKGGKAAVSGESNPFENPVLAFTPEQESILSRIEPRAIGSSLVLVALIAAIGYGGWSVLNEIQRVKLTPVEQTPVVAADLDPLAEATQGRDDVVAGGFTAPEALDRLYRPEALDAPVMVARDAPISTLDPSATGLFAQDVPFSTAEAEEQLDRAVPQVLASDAPELTLMAVRPAWVRVRAADGSILLEKILNAGEEFTLPQTEEAPVLTAGMSGSVYFKLNGALYGPAGDGADRIGDLALDLDQLQETYDLADLGGDPELARIVAEADAAIVTDE
ncbi:helix-turn-helix domain-containing protein [uncultured Shimia sp.]|uniref:helix-turn-helix domain-containing protein n=1 Tax=uncultured Shimia sp. TaxID=573152 RepID=UPI0026190DF5|nr:helix-turn-helix domain-containing protein [uncultured Shimia sp.]